MLDVFSADYLWMLFAGLFVLADLRFPDKGAWLGGVAAAATSFLVYFQIPLEAIYQAGVFALTFMLFLATRFAWKKRQKRRGAVRVVGYAKILAIDVDGSITAEFDRKEWPVVLLCGDPVEGMKLRITAVSDGVLWCETAVWRSSN